MEPPLNFFLFFEEHAAVELTRLTVAATPVVRQAMAAVGQHPASTPSPPAAIDTVILVCRGNWALPAGIHKEPPLLPSAIPILPAVELVHYRSGLLVGIDDSQDPDKAIVTGELTELLLSRQFRVPFVRLLDILEVVCLHVRQHEVLKCQNVL